MRILESPEPTKNTRLPPRRFAVIAVTQLSEPVLRRWWHSSRSTSQIIRCVPSPPATSVPLRGCQLSTSPGPRPRGTISGYAFHATPSSSATSGVSKQLRQIFTEPSSEPVISCELSWPFSRNVEVTRAPSRHRLEKLRTLCVFSQSQIDTLSPAATTMCGSSGWNSSREVGKATLSRIAMWSSSRLRPALIWNVDAFCSIRASRSWRYSLRWYSGDVVSSWFKVDRLCENSSLDHEKITEANDKSSPAAVERRRSSANDSGPGLIGVLAATPACGVSGVAATELLENVDRSGCGAPASCSCGNPREFVPIFPPAACEAGAPPPAAPPALSAAADEPGWPAPPVPALAPALAPPFAAADDVPNSSEPALLPAVVVALFPPGPAAPPAPPAPAADGCIEPVV
eukprot:comp22206_c0_seq1/m.52442 comp22206_c0_seq1/g.52442  ORF comp22206_c0_seq1/g.52442 comp22206_c0_seq1/m.52442 type:complete len:401 (-) comp22206_c0_seq1:514-1716(-)